MEAEPEYRWLDAHFECVRLLQEVPVAYPFRSNIFRSTFYVEGFPPCKQIELYCVVEPARRALLIDTGHPDLCGRTALDGVVEQLRVPWENIEVFLSHFHDDHDGNLLYCQFKGAARAYSGTTIEDFNAAVQEFLQLSSACDLAVEEAIRYANLVGGGKAAERKSKDWRSELTGGEVFSLAGYALEALPTPGHTANHVCLIDQAKRILFAGDHICDAPPGFMQFGLNQHLYAEYLESLAQLKAMNLQAVYMCHHNPLVGEHQINAFIELLEGRNKTLATKTHSVFSGDRLTVRDAAYRLAAHYSKGLDGFPVSVQVRRIATVFATLEYLFDVGVCDRAVNDEGALVYWEK